MANFDRWALIKLIEIFLVVACLVCKRVTDDEARSLFLYLQKVSREWSLLRNVTWDRVGAAVAHATFGGYFIITVALFIGKLVGELPTERRITERFFLIIGAILFIVLGSLAFAALDSVPHDLIDNAAILGSLALATGILFLVDASGPGRKKHVESSRTYQNFSNISRTPADSQQHLESQETSQKRAEQNGKSTKNQNGVQNGYPRSNQRTTQTEQQQPHVVSVKDLNNATTEALRQEVEQRFHKEVEDDFRRRFGIYGKDALDETEKGEPETIRPSSVAEQHSPVWSQIRKGQRGDIKIIKLEAPKRAQSKREPPGTPESPLDPGYVQYTAQHWGELEKTEGKTPRHSPTDV